MSLLLDALKKAAEQKAEKNRQADARVEASEQAGASDKASPEVNEPVPKKIREDTVLDYLSQDQTQIPPMAGTDAGDDDTALTVGTQDPTVSRHPQQEGSSGDETQLTSGVFDPTQIQLPANQRISESDDDTALTVGTEDPTVSRHPQQESSSGDETELTGAVSDPTQINLPASQIRDSVDDTEIHGLKSEVTQFDPSGLDQADDDQTQGLKFGRHQEELGDDTVINQPIAAESEDVQLTGRKEAAVDETELTDVGRSELEELRFEDSRAKDAEGTDISVGDISGFFEEDETVLLREDDVTEFIGGDGAGSEPLKPPKQSSPHVEERPSAGSSNEDDRNIGADDNQPGKFENENSPVAGPKAEDFSVSLFDADYTDHKAHLDQSELRLEDRTSTRFPDASEYSISLFDEDVTPVAPDVRKAGDTGRDVTDPGLSLADKTGDRSLTLIDVTETSLPGDHLTDLENTQASQITTDIDPPSRTITRADATATQTYAADNYDRTLLRTDAKQGSEFFTGMKSESGDILTPENAKKVFHSKISPQHKDNLKVYSAIAAVILVAFVGLGILQIEEDNEMFEMALRPLKHDPMPGLIKNQTDQGYTNIFAASSGAEVDARALELVENAEMIVGAENVVVDLGAGENGNNETAQSSELSPDQSESTVSDESQPLLAAGNESAMEDKISDLASGQSDAESPATLHIISKNTITEKDRLLQEAYAAYQHGSDDIALLKYNQVLDLEPGSRNALLARAAISIQNNKFEAAIQDYQSLLLANPKDSLAMSSLTAIANYSPEKSESLLKLMIRDEPNSPYLNFALGNVYGAQNRWSEAQGQYFTAFESNPDDPNYAYNLAVSLEHISQPKVAISYYQRALDNYANGLATFNRDVVDQRLEMLR